MRPIVTITLNPALDLSTTVPSVAAGPKLRCAEPRQDPGGGGINVSRVVAELGGTTTAFVVLGGATGAALEALLSKELETLTIFPIKADTRYSFSVTATDSNDQYRFVMPGPLWSDELITDALKQIRDVTQSGSLVVFSGSMPPGVPPDFPERLCATLQDCDVVLDMSGEALERFSKSSQNVFILRMDHAEGETLSGSALLSIEETAEYASSLVLANAARNVIIARGAEGSVLANSGGAWMVRAAKVPVDSKIGAGDSFVAAVVYAIAQDRDMQYAMQLGAAAASATVTTPATELCHREKIFELLPNCPIAKITD